MTGPSTELRTGAATNQMAVRDAYKDPHAGTCMPLARIAEITGLSRRAVAQAAGGLITRGLLARREVGCYFLTGAGQVSMMSGEILTCGPNGRHTAPIRRPNRKSTLRDRAWKALRIRGKATVAELLELSAAGGEKNPENNLQRYLRGLTRAGYTVALARRAPGETLTSNGFKRWLLVRDTGPQAPVLRKDGVYDRNLKQLFPFDGAQDRPSDAEAQR